MEMDPRYMRQLPTDSMAVSVASPTASGLTLGQALFDKFSEQYGEAAATTHGPFAQFIDAYFNQHPLRGHTMNFGVSALILEDGTVVTLGEAAGAGLMQPTTTVLVNPGR